jgi:hypothetical protein
MEMKESEKYLAEKYGWQGGKPNSAQGWKFSGIIPETTDMARLLYGGQFVFDIARHIDPDFRGYGELQSAAHLGKPGDVLLDAMKDFVGRLPSRQPDETEGEYENRLLDWCDFRTPNEKEEILSGLREAVNFYL